MISSIIRAGGLLLGAPIAAAGHALEAVGVLNFTGWQKQMKDFGAEMISGADHIAKQRDEREALVDAIGDLQQADPDAVAAAALALVAIKGQMQTNAEAAAAPDPAVVP
jgi:hypothetical protein